MCNGIQYLHTDCRHAKKFVVIEKCNSATDTDCINLTILQVMMVTAPRLCVHCFRREEAKLDQECEFIEGVSLSEIARVDAHFATGQVLTEQMAASLRGYQAQCRDDIVQVKAARDLKIRLFRQRQGVWGDG